jgi:diphthine-ammonia ligase
MIFSNSFNLMKLAVLFSGGKDSTYAMYKAMNDHDISCLITIKSINKESYMFHTPTIDMTKLQAKAIGLPLITVETKGEKEKELVDLKNAIKQAKTDYKIEGIVTGAILSVYQATRIQKICDELDIYCFNPLWQMDQIKLLNELLDNNFEIMITSVNAYPFDETWLGQILSKEMINELIKLQKMFKINPAGEGGETESLVLNAPFFKKKIKVLNYKINHKDYSGSIIINEAKLS